jgi:hypothetical protein
MSFYENILEYITDNTKRISTRAAIIILIVGCFILIDNIVGFSYYYNRQRKFEQLKSISILLQDSTLSESTKVNIRRLEKQTFERKNIIDYSVIFLKNVFDSKKGNTKDLLPSKYSRNNFWFLMSTSGIYLLLAIFVPLVLLLTDRKTGFFKLSASMLIFIIVMFFTSWFNYWLFDKLIPNVLLGHWIWNYLINFLIQIGLMIGLYWTTNIINKIES